MLNLPLRENIQTVIHQLEVGFGPRLLRYFLLFLVVFGLVGLYDLRAYQNRFTPEGMDAAQLARNIAAGKGYTTEFIRPFSLYLVQSYNQSQAPNSLVSPGLDFARVQNHPDLANPPVYPLLLAGLMKVLPLGNSGHSRSEFWADGGMFSRCKPDLLITLFNQVLLVMVSVIIFLIGRKLFDQRVAWTSTVLTFGCATLWRFSTSGISTLLLLLIFLGLTWCMIKIEELAREPQPTAHLTRWVIAAGILVGMGVLTRYSFGFMVVPVAAFLFLFSGPRRAAYILIVLSIFVVILTPWCVRNYSICGEPFGIAGFSAMENTSIYPQFSLERSIHANFYGFILKPYLAKMTDNLRAIFSNDLPTLGGSWATLFFLAGLMLGFNKVPIKRTRYFLLLCLGIFLIIQPFSQTAFSDETPACNTANLLILLVPLVFMYGACFFFTLLDQLELPLIELRYPIIGGFVTLSSLPLIFTMFAPDPVADPYLPQAIQRFATWMQPDELVMSDAPWAVAWYGNCQCVWLSRDANTDFFEINNNFKRVNALCLTSKTINQNYMNFWVNSGTNSWEAFIHETTIDNKYPPNFPLKIGPSGFFPECIFLTDHPRWKMVR